MHNQKPHLNLRKLTFFRNKGVLFLSILSILAIIISGILIIIANTPEKNANAQSLTSSEILKEVNNYRISKNLKPLTINTQINKAANAKAYDMASKGYFAHTSPSGIRGVHLIKKQGYEYQKAGENLALHFENPKELVAAWINSPDHNENLIDKGFTETGIAVIKGNFKNFETYFVVQLYAKPLEKPAAPIQKTQTLTKNSNLNLKPLDQNPQTKNLDLETTKETTPKEEKPTLPSSSKEDIKKIMEQLRILIISII